MARPTKLSRVVGDRILASLRDGNRRGLAARSAGVSEPTFFRWLSDRRPQYREFRESVERAEAEAEAKVVKVLRDAMPRSPQAAIWWLENRSPEWRRRKEPPAVSDQEQLGPAAEYPRVIVVTWEQLQEIAAHRLRAANAHLAELDAEKLGEKRRRLVIEG